MKGLFKQPVKQAGGHEGKPLLLYLLPGLMVAVVTLLLLAVLAHQVLSRGADEQARRAMRQAADVLAVGIAEEIRNRVDRLRFFAAQSGLAGRVAAGMSDEQRQVETARLSTWLPGVLDVRVLPAGWQRLDPLDQGLPAPLGFAGVEMVRRVVAMGKASEAEVHQADTGKPYIAVAVPLWQDGRAVGALMAAYPANSLTGQVEALGALPGLLRLEQWVDKQHYVLAQTGRGEASGLEDPETAHVSGTIWQVSYQAAPQHAFGLQLLPFLGFVLLGLLPVGLIFILQLRVLLRALHHDLEGIREQVDALAKGRDIGVLHPRLAAVGPLRSHLTSLLVNHRRQRLNDAAAAGQQEQARTAEAETPKPVVESVDIPAPVFRAYDIRGVADEQLTEAFAQRLGQALAARVQENGGHKVVVGQDVRHSSPRLLRKLVEGLTRGGCDVVELGMVPTPLVYFGEQALSADGAVMVTGSHNPAGENGFKIVIGGQVLAGDALAELRAPMASHMEPAARQGSVRSEDVATEYVGRVVEDVSLSRPLRVVVDAGNGSAGPMALQLLEALGCDVIPLFCEPDGSFPHHHPDPSRPENLAQLMLEVQAKEADVGLAFDGDGDRLGVVDSAGQHIWPDRVLMLLARDVLTRHPGGDILYDVKCSRHVGRFVLASGGRPIMSPSGHARMRTRMAETSALLGGEFSGHFFIRERWYGFDDGLYAAARLLELLAADPRSSEQLFAEVPASPTTPEYHVGLPEGDNLRLIERLAGKAVFEDAEVVTLDGLRIEFADGWALVRASNTTPSLVFRFEADSAPALERIQTRIRTWLSGALPELALPF